MDKIELRILGISSTHSQTFAYALILAEKKGQRRLPIVIGNFEAQSIAIELEKMKPSRPLTHDLFKSFAQVFNVIVKEVVISKFKDGIFYAEILCSDGIQEKTIDARTSDAVAIALRFNAPIFTNSMVMDAAGISLDDEKSNPASQKEKPKRKSASISKIKEETDLSALTLKELNALLKIAVQKENYEKASQIRDEIQSRKEKGKGKSPK